jgi:hypothetical protein
MNAIYFIKKKNGNILYKTDTFWSTSELFTHAKMHDDSVHDQERFFDGLEYKLKRRYATDSEEYTDSIFGYQIVTGTGNFCPGEGDILSNPIYLRKILSISDDRVESVDYRVSNRNEKINDIISE